MSAHLHGAQVEDVREVEAGDLVAVPPCFAVCTWGVLGWGFIGSHVLYMHVVLSTQLPRRMMMYPGAQSRDGRLQVFVCSINLFSIASSSDTKFLNLFLRCKKAGSSMSGSEIAQLEARIAQHQQLMQQAGKYTFLKGPGARISGVFIPLGLSAVAAAGLVRLGWWYRCKSGLLLSHNKLCTGYYRLQQAVGLTNIYRGVGQIEVGGGGDGCCTTGCVLLTVVQKWFVHTHVVMHCTVMCEHMAAHGSLA